jgi:anti-sigma-K factor RskA
MQHFEIQEQIPLYAIGGLTAEESARVAEHLRVCSSCRALLSEYQLVADELLETVPVQVAPARLGVRLQNLVQADERRAARTASRPLRRMRFWEQSVRVPRWALALLLVTSLFALGAAGFFAFQSSSRDASAPLLMQLLTARDLRFVELTSAVGTPSNKGILCVQPENSAALLWLYNLPSLDAEHVYQIWLREDDARISGGTVRVDQDGRAVAVIHAPRPLKYYQEIGLTIEPAAGSQAPTTPRVVGARLD